MVSSQLIDYIIKARNAGMGEAVIVRTLQENGWNQTDIDAALLAIAPRADSANDSIDSEKKLWPFWQLAKTTIAIYRRRIIHIHVVLLISTCLSIIPMAFAALLIGTDQNTSAQFDLVMPTSSLVTYIGLVLMAGIAAQWGQSALTHAVSGDADMTDVGMTLKRATAQFVASSHVSSLQTILSAAAGMAFVVPGVVFFVWFSLAPFVLAVEGKSGFNAILTSKYYIRGNTFGVLWRLMIFWGLAGAILLGLAIAVTAMAMANSPLITIATILLILTFLGIISLASCFHYALYTNLIDIKDQPDPLKLGARWPFVLTAFLGIVVMGLLLLLSSFLSVGESSTGRFSGQRGIASQANVLIIKEALSNYYNDVGSYPASLSLLIPTYLPSLIGDPSTGEEYKYFQIEDGGSWLLCLPDGKECLGEASTTKPLPKVR